jgi:Glutathione S-transferase, N-terminal domain
MARPIGYGPHTDYVGTRAPSQRDAWGCPSILVSSPVLALARILVLEKALEGRVEIIAAKTRATNSPYYQINPSGRVPYLIDDSGVGMEDSQLICAYLDSLDGKPRFHDPRRQTDWAYQRLEFAARNMCEGICVYGALDPRSGSRRRCKARLWRYYCRPPAACRLDALHVRVPFDAKDSPTVMMPNTILMSAFGTKHRHADAITVCPLLGEQQT